MLSIDKYLLFTLFCVVAMVITSFPPKQKIFYDEAELVEQLLINMTEWTYVQQNVDGGFYIHFIEMNAILNLDELLHFFKLFSNKAVYFESNADPTHQPLEKDKVAIERFHQVGWNVTQASQNYGWTVERDEILAHYNLTEHVLRRPDFVQLGL